MKLDSQSNLTERALRYARRWRSNREPFNGRRILMIHPPKCGGTSVAQSIKWRTWHSYFDLNNGASITGHELLQHALRPYENVSLDAYRRSIVIYYAMVGKKFIYGHFGFDSNVFDPLSADYDYLTVLRNPVDRFISQYYFTKQTQKLQDFLETDRAKSWATDYRRRFSDDEFEGNDDLGTRSAIENLKKFEVVGKLEDVEKLEADFKRRYGKSISVPKFNRGRYAEVDPRLKEKVSELCQNDIEIYRAV